MRRLFCFTLLFLFFSGLISWAQEVPIKQDSLKRDLIDPTRTDSIQADPLPVRLMRLNPAENVMPQFTPYQRYTLFPQQSRESGLPPIHWEGASSDFINSKSRTAIASMSPAQRLLLYSTATIGLVETPYFGKANYYVINAGAVYSLSSAMNMGVSGGYDSNFGSIPFWNAGWNMHYRVSDDFSVDGGVTYLKTAGNMFNLNQSAVLLDLHGRYRLSEDWFVNAYGGMPVLQRNNRATAPMMPMMNNTYYGGSLENWFKPTMGVEGGVIWIQDMFTGKMRPRPKLELLFRPGKR